MSGVLKVQLDATNYAFTSGELITGTVILENSSSYTSLCQCIQLSLQCTSHAFVVGATRTPLPLVKVDNYPDEFVDDAAADTRGWRFAVTIPSAPQSFPQQQQYANTTTSPSSWETRFLPPTFFKSHCGVKSAFDCGVDWTIHASPFKGKPFEVDACHELRIVPPNPQPHREAATFEVPQRVIFKSKALSASPFEESADDETHRGFRDKSKAFFKSGSSAPTLVSTTTLTIPQDVFVGDKLKMQILLRPENELSSFPRHTSRVEDLAPISITYLKFEIRALTSVRAVTGNTTTRDLATGQTTETAWEDEAVMTGDSFETSSRNAGTKPIELRPLVESQQLSAQLESKNIVKAVTPSFSTHNITHRHYLRIVINLECAGETFKLSKKYGVHVCSGLSPQMMLPHQMENDGVVVPPYDAETGAFLTENMERPRAASTPGMSLEFANPRREHSVLPSYEEAVSGNSRGLLQPGPWQTRHSRSAGQLSSEPRPPP
ncbi:MAG: hypothetical protein M1831_002244 [Alyxoria varia]|nr:MAG: hypothetical protein M1831_002244 [Alyxoria varia]